MPEPHVAAMEEIIEPRRPGVLDRFGLAGGDFEGRKFIGSRPQDNLNVLALPSVASSLLPWVSTMESSAKIRWMSFSRR